MTELEFNHFSQVEKSSTEDSSVKKEPSKVLESVLFVLKNFGNQQGAHEKNAFCLKKRKVQIMDAVTLIPRFVFAFFLAFSFIGFMGVSSVFYRRDNYNPKAISSSKVPVILIHGSSSNRCQWNFFRYFLKSQDTGHVFSLNLNKEAFWNDKKSISDYAQIRLAEMIKELKEKYRESGIDLDQVVLVGHSMGGLVGANYALDCAERTGVQVKALISMGSPWEGSKIADKVYRIDQKPEGAFCTKNQTRRDLKNRLMKKERSGEVNVYTFSSTFDLLVRPSFSQLEVAPERKMHSKFHNHLSVMLDPFLAKRIREQWIVPNMSDLPNLKKN